MGRVCVSLLITLLSSSLATRRVGIAHHMTSAASSQLSSSASVNIYSGQECLDRLLLQAKFKDISSPVLDDALFEKWCKDFCKRRIYSDSEFSNRVAVREIRRNNREALSIAEARLEAARAEYNATDGCREIALLDKRIVACTQAVASMRAFLIQTDSGSVLNEARKEQIRAVGLANKTALLQESLERRRIVAGSTPSYAVYLALQNELDQLHESIGLTKAVQRSSASVRYEGHGRTLRGRRFEDFAESITPAIIEHVSRRHSIPPESLFCLRNVKLGMASTLGSTAEMDCLICFEDTSQLKARHGVYVKVAGVVEVKKNCDDLGDAFLGYQTPLHWLCGNVRFYKSSDFVTRHFTSGHFDREITHNLRDDSNTYIFTKDSFSLLTKRRIGRLTGFNSSEDGVSATSTQPEQEYFLEDLYFITMMMDIEGVSSKASSWCASKIGDEEAFDLELSDSAALRRLRARVNERYPFRLSALDAVHLYKREGVHANIYACSYEPST